MLDVQGYWVVSPNLISFVGKNSINNHSTPCLWDSWALKSLASLKKRPWNPEMFGTSPVPRDWEPIDIPQLQRPPRGGYSAPCGRIWLNIHHLWRRNGYLLLFCKKRKFLWSNSAEFAHECLYYLHNHHLRNLLSYCVSKISVHVHLCMWPIISAGLHSISMDSPLPLCAPHCRQWDDARCLQMANAYPTSFIVILATKIPNKQKISVAKTTDLLTNHIWRKHCILISFQLHPLPRSAPTLQPALASCSFFPGLVIHLGLCGTLFQSIDATSLSAKELRNTLLRCCFFDVRNQRVRAAHKRWRFKSCKKGTVHLKGTAKNTKTLVFAIPLYWQ